MDTKKIQYEDDIVVVYDKVGNILYTGIEDYEPFKREPWRWDEEKGYYTYEGMIKKCFVI